MSIEDKAELFWLATNMCTKSVVHANDQITGNGDIMSGGNVVNFACHAALPCYIANHGLIRNTIKCRYDTSIPAVAMDTFCDFEISLIFYCCIVWNIKMDRLMLNSISYGLKLEVAFKQNYATFYSKTIHHL